MVPLKQNLLEPIDVRGCLLIELQCLSSLMPPPPLHRLQHLRGDRAIPQSFDGSHIATAQRHRGPYFEADEGGGRGSRP